MGKFTKSKNVPAYLKQHNYYSKSEKFDEVGEVEESVDCESCGKTPTTNEHTVKNFNDFLFEKKAKDLTGDGKIDTEDWKMAKDLAIKGKKIAATFKKEKGSEEPKMPKGKAKMPIAKSKKIMKIDEYATQRPAMMVANEGHTCSEGSHYMTSEAAHYLVESVCESIVNDAREYETRGGVFEDYVNEAAAYIEKKMYDMVDDGRSSVNENWANESACSESTKSCLNEMCEAMCHEGLAIHVDPSERNYNNYVKEAIGCFRNGIKECAMSGISETSSYNSDTPIIDADAIKRYINYFKNDENLKKRKEIQAAEIFGPGADPSLIDIIAKEISTKMK